MYYGWLFFSNMVYYHVLGGDLRTSFSLRVPYKSHAIQMLVCSLDYFYFLVMQTIFIIALWKFCLRYATVASKHGAFHKVKKDERKQYAKLGLTLFLK